MVQQVQWIRSMQLNKILIICILIQNKIVQIKFKEENIKDPNQELLILIIKGKQKLKDLDFIMLRMMVELIKLMNKFFLKSFRNIQYGYRVNKSLIHPRELKFCS